MSYTGIFSVHMFNIINLFYYYMFVVKIYYTINYNPVRGVLDVFSVITFTHH